MTQRFRLQGLDRQNTNLSTAWKPNLCQRIKLSLFESMFPGQTSKDLSLRSKAKQQRAKAEATFGLIWSGFTPAARVPTQPNLVVCAAPTCEAKVYHVLVTVEYHVAL